MAYLTDEELAALDPESVANDGDFVARESYLNEQELRYEDSLHRFLCDIETDCKEICNWAQYTWNLTLLEEVHVQLRKIVANTHTC